MDEHQIIVDHLVAHYVERDKARLRGSTRVTAYLADTDYAHIDPRKVEHERKLFARTKIATLTHLHQLLHQQGEPVSTEFEHMHIEDGVITCIIEEAPSLL